MLIPSLVNHRFKSFQWQAKWYWGIKYQNTLWSNVFFFWIINNFYITLKHIDLITKYIKWRLKKNCFIFFSIPCNYPITKKPAETRMGKGKGKIVTWAIPIKWGSVFFYLKCINKTKGLLVLTNLLQKMPFWAWISFTKHYLNELTAWCIIYNAINYTNKLLIFKYIWLKLIE